METRTAKRKANQAHQNQPLQKKRVVLGELPNLQSLIVPQSVNPGEPKLVKNPKIKKATVTKKKILSSGNAVVTVKEDNKIVHEDIDENSSTNDKSNGPFVSEIYKYLRAMEMEKKRRPITDYIEKVQKDVTSTMRGILVDWLVEVAEEYRLLSDTLHLSVSYIDRFLSVNPVSRSRLQLLGVSSMLIASKYEEINPPQVEEFCFITDNTYNKSEVVKMEADILKSLDFEMGNPTVLTFLRRFTGIACKNENAPSLQFEFLSYYLVDLSLLDYYCLKFLPSLVAASVIFLARFIIWPDVYPWTSALYECSGYESVDLKECVLILHDLYMARRASFQATRDKYKQHKFKYVANLPSPPHLPNDLFEEE